MTLIKKYFSTDLKASLESRSELSNILSDMESVDIFNFIIGTNDDQTIIDNTNTLFENLGDNSRVLISKIKAFQLSYEKLLNFVDKHDDIVKVGTEALKLMGNMFNSINEIEKVCQSILKSSGFETNYEKIKNYRPKKGLSRNEMEIFSLPYEPREAMGYDHDITNALSLADSMFENTDYPMRVIHNELSDGEFENNYNKNVNEIGGLKPSLSFISRLVLD